MHHHLCYHAFELECFLNINDVDDNLVSESLCGLLLMSPVIENICILHFSKS